MCGVVVVVCGRYDPQVIRRVFRWTWHYLRRAASADFTCAIRCLAREVEKTGTGLSVSPPLLYTSGPKTTIRPTAELTLLHVGHPQLSGLALFTSVRVGKDGHPFKIRSTCSSAT